MTGRSHSVNQIRKISLRPHRSHNKKEWLEWLVCKPQIDLPSTRRNMKDSKCLGRDEIGSPCTMPVVFLAADAASLLLYQKKTLDPVSVEIHSPGPLAVPDQCWRLCLAPNQHLNRTMMADDMRYNWNSNQSCVLITCQWNSSTVAMSVSQQNVIKFAKSSN